MDLIGRQWYKNVGKNAVFRRLVEVSGRHWTLIWWPGRELNPRHADFQSAALPTELPGLSKSRVLNRRFGRPSMNNRNISHLALTAGSPLVPAAFPGPAAPSSSPELHQDLGARTRLPAPPSPTPSARTPSASPTP